MLHLYHYINVWKSNSLTKLNFVVGIVLKSLNKLIMDESASKTWRILLG